MDTAPLNFATLAIIFVVPTILKSPLGSGKRVKMMNTALRMIALVLSTLGFAAFYFDATNISVGLFFVLLSVAYVRSPSRRWPSALATCSDGVKGKVAMVTGCTSGIGVETARALAYKGAHVFLVARNETKLNKVKASILKGSPSAKLTIIVCDLNDLKSVRSCAKQFADQVKTGEVRGLDILINNAGVMAMLKRSETAQGFERQMGINHIGHFLLTTLLLPALERSAPSRVVSVSSSAHLFVDPAFINVGENLETLPYDPWTAYGNSKYANILFAREFHRLFGGKSGKNVAAFSVMPGGIFTGLQSEVPPTLMFKWMVLAPFFFKSVSEGAATSLMCATSPFIESDGGKYFDNCKVGKFEEVTKPEAATALWKKTEALVKNYASPVF